MKIEKIGPASYPFNDDETVKIQTDKGTFHVQLIDCEFRGDLGCKVIAGEDCRMEHDREEEIDLIVEAEKFSKKFFEEFPTKFYTIFGEQVFIIGTLAGYRLVIKNNKFIDRDQSRCELRYLPV